MVEEIGKSKSYLLKKQLASTGAAKKPLVSVDRDAQTPVYRKVFQAIVYLSGRRAVALGRLLPSVGRLLIFIGRQLASVGRQFVSAGRRLASLRRLKKTLLYTGLVSGGLFVLGLGTLFAQQNVPIPFFNLGVRGANTPQEVSLSLQVLLLLSVLTIAPSILIMMTSFIRITIILKFVQRALSLQQEPPNQVIMGLALFISFFIMAPTLTVIYDEAYVPYANQEISTTAFFSAGLEPLKEFMLKQTREKDIDLFLYLGNKVRPQTPDDVSLIELIPAFMISEITHAFQIGIYLFVPFIVIDMIVASILMSMGMILIPPIAISLPFKIILFVLIDGWHLITLQAVQSFNL